MLVTVPDASKYFLGAIVAYSNEAKVKILHVSEETLKIYGAVSEESAREMAQGAVQCFNSNYALSITGIAGPTGATSNKPVGAVSFAIAGNQEVMSWTVHFLGDRENIMKKAALEALYRLKIFLQ